MNRQDARLFKLLPSDKTCLKWMKAYRHDHYELLMAFKEESPTYLDLSARFGVPVGTIRSRLSRARHTVLKWRDLLEALNRDQDMQEVINYVAGAEAIQP